MGKRDKFGEEGCRKWWGLETYLLNMMEVLKSEVVLKDREGVDGGKEGRRGWEEVGGLFARELGALSLSGAVLPMVP